MNGKLLIKPTRKTQHHKHQGEMIRVLVDMDHEQYRELWKHLFPHFPSFDGQMNYYVLASMHMARTQMDPIPDKLRFYSHRWLLDNGFPSQLPDRLKPSAEKLYPVSEGSVGIALQTQSPIMAPILDQIVGAMSDAVMDCYANNDKEPVIVKKQMERARVKTTKKLVGIILDRPIRKRT